MATQERLRFKVRGQIFESTTTTFSNANADSSLTAMLDGARRVEYDQVTEYFIAADPVCFGVLLHLLQTDELHLPPHIFIPLLYQEAHRFKLVNKLHSAIQAKFDGNNLRLTTSITGRTFLNESPLIRATAKGDCAVANGNILYVYNWMFRELPTMNLDYMKIVGMEWCDRENLVISARMDSSSRGGGGKIGIFNPQTHELKHSFPLVDYQHTIMTPGNIAIGFDRNVFVCCKDDSYRKRDSIVVWDIRSSHPIASMEVESVGKALKLQWLPTTNSLMAVIRNLRGNVISLWDTRASTHAYSYTMKSPRRVVDAVGIEEMNCVCLLDDKGRFGFVDMRKLGDQPWRFKEHENPWFPPLNESRLGVRPKLGWHEGKLFCSVDGIISIYSWYGSRWQSTFQLVQPNRFGGPIHDFSIGGERLFSLQAHPCNIYNINVWETPHQY